MKITKERWLEAQAQEKIEHSKYEDGNLFFSRFYANYFKLLGMDEDQGGKSIVEVGCAFYPGLAYVTNYRDSAIVEPMFSDELARFVDTHDVTWYMSPLEDLVLPVFDEMWLFNVLQHTLDPDAFVEAAKKYARLIRFFEPINVPTGTCHPHQFTLQDFQGWFGGDAKEYVWDKKTDYTHVANCAMGSYYTGL